jgi:hypothetical protein
LKHYSFFVTFLVLVFTGCSQNVHIQGRVVDVRGQALPGVAVSVRDTEFEAITDGVGTYALRCAPGPFLLEFVKTGYTPGHLDLQQATPEDTGYAVERIPAIDVVLWPLPPGKGIFVFNQERARYQEASPAEPKRFLSRDRGAIFGIQIEPELTLETDTPFLISHKLPAYDVHLDRLQQMEVALPQTNAAPAFTQKAWVKGAPISIAAAPVDEPGQLLIEIRPFQPLDPGIYAMHWGALDGYTSTEARIYLFKITDPNAIEGEAEGEGEG